MFGATVVPVNALWAYADDIASVIGSAGLLMNPVALLAAWEQAIALPVHMRRR